MKTYRTSEIALLSGVHPNTVRFYEEVGLLPPIKREGNGYRIYTDVHLLYMQLIRTTLHVGIIGNNLRHKAIMILKTAAQGNVIAAADLAKEYQTHLIEELDNAEHAVSLISTMKEAPHPERLAEVINGRKEAAALLNISVDILRDWERNGLIQIPRSSTKRLQYGPKEINLLRIILVLRNARYSQMSIRRLLNKLNQRETNLQTIIDTPDSEDDIYYVTNRYISALKDAISDSEETLNILHRIEQLLQQE